MTESKSTGASGDANEPLANEIDHSELIAVANEFGDHYGKPRAELPEKLRRFVERSFVPFVPDAISVPRPGRPGAAPRPVPRREDGWPTLISLLWDDLGANQQRRLVTDWIAQFDPALSRQKAEAAFAAAFREEETTQRRDGCIVASPPEVRQEPASLEGHASIATTPEPKQEVDRALSDEDTSTLAPPRRTGRRPKWDWDGAKAAFAAHLGQDPDGLPQIQADAERWVADWFSKANQGDAPPIQEVRLRVVAPVYEAARSASRTK